MPEYLGGDANQWHIHNVGMRKISLGSWNKWLVDNKPAQNWKICQEALNILDHHQHTLGKSIPNYVALHAAIEKLRDEHVKPEVGGKKKGDIALWSKEAQEMADAYIKSQEFQDWLKANRDGGW